MNILFVLRTMDLGGLEVVTSVLANKFEIEGNGVHVFAFTNGKGTAIERFRGLHISLGREYSSSKENVRLLREILIEKQIDIVINQWGLPFIPIRTIEKARRGLGIKVITVYHNDPLFNGRIQDVKIDLYQTSNILKMTFLKLKLWMFGKITSRGMSYNYWHSDLFMVLSTSYIKHFEQFTGIKCHDRLLALTNPITINTSGYVYDAKEKIKEIIYVGRVDNTQKRVHRVIDTWLLLEEKYPDWRLSIVGDGSERKNLEKKVKELGLKNISFEGFQSPVEYYRRAKILMLTSEYEGFPLVLAECMSFGVVPAVYGSYSAVYDIVEDGVNGIIFPYNKESFSAEDAAMQMEKIMTDDSICQCMAKKAMETSKRYSVDEIYKSWRETFDRLCK